VADYFDYSTELSVSTNEDNFLTSWEPVSFKAGLYGFSYDSLFVCFEYERHVCTTDSCHGRSCTELHWRPFTLNDILLRFPWALITKWFGRRRKKIEGQHVENEATQLLSFAKVGTRRTLSPWDHTLVTVMHSNFLFLFTCYVRSRFGTITRGNHRHGIIRIL